MQNRDKTRNLKTNYEDSGDNGRKISKQKGRRRQSPSQKSLTLKTKMEVRRSAQLSAMSCLAPVPKLFCIVCSFQTHLQVSPQIDLTVSYPRSRQKGAKYLET